MDQYSEARRLLILDDEPAVAQTIAAMAEIAGFETRIAVHAQECFDRLEDWQPTHVMVDLMMPDMDGVQVLRNLAERGCRARIIISSGLGSRVLDAARRSADEHGLDIAGALAKPFKPADLRALLYDSAPATAVRGPAPFAVTEADLRLALSRGELQVYYQPKILCASGELAGFEALVRWHHPQAGVIVPDRFIGLAESCGLIDELTHQVVGQAFAWLAAADPQSQWHVSVNLSARSLADFGLADALFASCSSFGIAPHRVVLEVTETCAMSEPTVALDVLTRLRVRGFQVSIDDFGIGYSSMLQLVRLPFSEMKIDKSFTVAAMQSHEARAVIRSAVTLGHSLGLQVTAEGVEDAATLDYLRKLGCDLAQGYLIAAAMPGDAVAAWMAQRAAQSTAEDTCL